MVDPIGPRPVVPVPRIRRPVDDDNKDEAQSSAKDRRKKGAGAAPGEGGAEENKGRLIDDQA